MVVFSARKSQSNGMSCVNVELSYNKLMKTNVIQNISHTSALSFKQRFCLKLLRQFLRKGNLRVFTSSDAFFEVGDGTGPCIQITMPSPKVLLKIAKSSSLGFGESYIDGDWFLLSGDLVALVNLLFENMPKYLKDDNVITNIRRKLFIARKNSISKSSNNVVHHYDIGNDLYSSFLDKEMNYSCAFYDNSNITLLDAQKHKNLITIQRLNVRPNMKVLELGCGWGALSRILVAQNEVEYTGITLSKQQIELANGSKNLLPLQHRNLLEYKLEDYRQHRENEQEVYDRIVSIGMFEHIGVQQYGVFFKTINRLLKPDGMVLIHTIVRPKPGITSKWIDQYIFPGGYIAAFSEIERTVIDAGFEVVEQFDHEGFHYIRTLQDWRKAFSQSWPRLKNKYDDRFYRMWDLYLASSQNAFNEDQLGFHVKQILLKKRT